MMRIRTLLAIALTLIMMAGFVACNKEEARPDADFVAYLDALVTASSNENCEEAIKAVNAIPDEVLTKAAANVKALGEKGPGDDNVVVIDEKINAITANCDRCEGLKDAIDARAEKFDLAPKAPPSEGCGCEKGGDCNCVKEGGQCNCAKAEAAPAEGEAAPAAAPAEGEAASEGCGCEKGGDCNCVKEGGQCNCAKAEAAPAEGEAAPAAAPAEGEAAPAAAPAEGEAAPAAPAEGAPAAPAEGAPAPAEAGK